jgi:hypothetical protein
MGSVPRPMVIPENRFLLITIAKDGQGKVKISCQNRFAHSEDFFETNGINFQRSDVDLLK